MACAMPGVVLPMEVEPVRIILVAYLFVHSVQPPWIAHAIVRDVNRTIMAWIAHAMRDS